MKTVKERIKEQTVLDDTPNPVVVLMFDFFTEPYSSNPAYTWGVFTAWLVAFYVLSVGLATCDGPNQYEGREDKSSYPFLLTTAGYWKVTLITQIPLVIDAFGRLICLICVFMFSENRRLLKSLRDDSFKATLFVCDILGILPFLIAACYTKPQNVKLTSDESFWMEMVVLLSTGRILRITKDIPAIWAIRITLGRSMEHLILPFFVFFIFNITAAVLLYFLEPCYDVTLCPWHDLFEASFFSVVTMTTTGYGNQTPQYAVMRLFACFVMVFGAVFMSMPLAIIGNEYSDAWEEVETVLSEEHKKRLSAGAKKLGDIFSQSIKLAPVTTIAATVEKLRSDHAAKVAAQLALQQGHQNTNVPSDSTAENSGNVGNSLDGTEGGKLKVVEMLNEKLRMVYTNILQRSSMLESHRQIMVLIKKIDNESRNATRLSPMILMYLSEIRGWIVTLETGSKFAIEQMTQDVKKPDGPTANKRLSIVAGHSNHQAMVSQVSAPVVDDSESDGEEAQDKGNHDIESVTLFQLIWDKIVGQKDVRHETETSIMMKKLEKDPTNFRNRMWQLLEVHDSSREARILQILILILIMLSVLLLFSETLSSWNHWGPDSNLCGSVLKAYCADKHSNILDPGCFVIDNFGSATETKLRFDCENDDCWRHGFNFGSMTTNMTCDEDDGSVWIQPFQSTSTLYYTYGSPNLFTSRNKMHRISDVCRRMECNPIDEASFDGQSIFYRSELVITALFTIEVLMRISVADSVVRYFSSAMNIFDLCAIVPFYIEVSGYSGAIDFAIISSSPENYFVVLARSFKVFRLYKLVRHFKATKVFIDTARKCIGQLMGILGFMFGLVILFAIILYQVENGVTCFVGDPGCVPPKSIASIVHPGDRIVLNKLGQLSKIPDVFYGLWFSFVTLTTTGYGDIVPVTNVGQVMTVFLMLAGSCYLSMPLTVASSTFYEVHQLYTKKKEAKNLLETQRAQAAVLAAKAAKDMAWKRRLQQIRISLSVSLDSLDALFADLQKPASREYRFVEGRKQQSPLLARCLGIKNNLNQVISSIARDLETLALTTASINNRGSSNDKDGRNSVGATNFMIC